MRGFRVRFERVCVLHSGLSDGEMFDQWHGIASGRYDVVIDSPLRRCRAAADLGLIIIDEEHEWTYKQRRPPSLPTRDAAIELAPVARPSSSAAPRSDNRLVRARDPRRIRC